MMGFGMLYILPLMVLVPLLLVALLVLGLAQLIRSSNLLVGQPTAPAITTAMCPSCHRVVQAGRRNCPYCGQKLA